MAERVGVRELRQNLSRWLRRVEAGESFEVTERGEPIALLAPIRAPTASLRRLAGKGRIAQLGEGLAQIGPPTTPGTRSIGDVLDELREERI